MKFILIFLLLTTTIFAAPAFNKLREFKQADGTTFTAKTNGNQHLNWVETEDGEILKYNQESKNFEYATIEDNMLKASGITYEKNNAKRAPTRGQTNKLHIDDVTKLWSEKRRDAQNRKNIK